MSIIEELKRRNVFRVSAAYLALGWVMTQVTGAVVPALHLPDSIPSIVVWVGVIGFPFVVLFSWVYELTPEGLKREREVASAESITHVTGRRLDVITISLLVVAILMFGFDRFSPRQHEPMPAATVAATSTAVPATAPAAVAPAGPAVPAIDDKSIAVLPFVNMSSDKEQEYFSDGISEELLNLLAKIPELRVIARTSSFSYKGKEVKVEQIAQELHVAHLLEGSIRKSGNKVRITAQLIRAADSSHLWSETYDRDLSDIFAVQDEISAAVVAQLKLQLLGAAPQAKKADPKAYALYLQARQLGRQVTPEALEQSIALYQQVLAIDPSYAAAWAGLSRSYRSQMAGLLIPFDKGYQLALEAANKALALDPNLASAHAELGRIETDFNGDFAVAARYYEKALELAPDAPDILQDAAILAGCLGNIDLNTALDAHVVANDPINPRGHSNLGLDYTAAGRYDEAITSFRTALSLSPGRLSTGYFLEVALLLNGDYEAALRAAQQEGSEPWRLLGLPMAYHALGKKAEADAALAELIRKYEKEMSYNIAYVFAYLNDADRAFEWLDKALVYKDPGMAGIVIEPLFANIRKDPRWLPFLRRIGKAPEQLAAIHFDVKLPD